MHGRTWRFWPKNHFFRFSDPVLRSIWYIFWVLSVMYYRILGWKSRKLIFFSVSARSAPRKFWGYFGWVEAGKSGRRWKREKDDFFGFWIVVGTFLKDTGHETWRKRDFIEKATNRDQGSGYDGSDQKITFFDFLIQFWDQFDRIFGFLL